MPTPPPDERYDYIGRKRECGCVVAICHDDPDDPGMAAEWVSAWMRRGLIVERVPTSEAVALLRDCPHGQQRLAI